MSLICFRKESYVSKLPILRLCYATTTFYILPLPTGISSESESKMAKRNFGVFSTGEIEMKRKKSVVVNGFAEAAPTRAKQGKDSHMIFFQKKKKCLIF